MVRRSPPVRSSLPVSARGVEADDGARYGFATLGSCHGGSFCHLVGGEGSGRADEGFLAGECRSIFTVALLQLSTFGTPTLYSFDADLSKSPFIPTDM
jgi:hypothetical protein